MSNFYVITFRNIHTGNYDCSRTFTRIANARKMAAWYKAQGFADNVKIMQGGRGGMIVE